jgi:hypothetical protein
LNLIKHPSSTRQAPFTDDHHERRLHPPIDRSPQEVKNKMLTIKEFRTRHELSESAFTRLVKTVQSTRQAPVTHRSGNTWIVDRPDLLEAELAKRPQKSKPEVEVIEAELMAIETTEFQESALTKAFNDFNPSEIATYEYESQGDSIALMLQKIQQQSQAFQQSEEDMKAAQLARWRDEALKEALLERAVKEEAKLQIKKAFQSQDAAQAGMQKKPVVEG